METEFWAAIAGAIVAGGISLGGQWLVIREARKERDANRTNRVETLSHSLFLKIRDMHANLNFICNHIEGCIKSAKFDVEDDLWTCVVPIVWRNNNIFFSTDELSFILSLQKPDLTNRIIRLQISYNEDVDLFSEYNTMRTDFQHQTPTDHFDDGVYTKRFSPEEMSKHRSKMVSMNAFIDSLRIQGPKDRSDASYALRLFVDTVNQDFDMKLRYIASTKKS